MKNKFKITVVGGGTAGWLTALCLQHKIPESIVTVIESSEIGILGAGEGVTPHFVSFFEELGIDISEVFKHASATVKNGIMFTNWHGDGTQYFHPFHDGKYTPHKIIDYAYVHSDPNEVIFSWHTSKQNKTKFFYKQETNEYLQHGSSALHFNACMLALFLKSKGIERSIQVKDAVVENVFFDLDNNIKCLSLGDGSFHETDFVFDCTGFKRMFIGKYFKSQWISLSKHLPANKALAFFLDVEESQIPPYTEAIAMKYGWVWKIPTQDRYGCGYVYDGNFITDDQARDEIKQYFGEKIVEGKTFSFEPGFFKETWKNNCIALGLSSGFVEPLEATSIWVLINSLKELLTKHLPGLLLQVNDRYRQSFNNYVNDINKDIADFIQLHYITERNDTDFWKNFQKNNIVLDNVEFYQNNKSYKDYFLDDRYKYFGKQPFVQCGVKIFDKEIVRKELEVFIDHKKSIDIIDSAIDNINNEVKKCIYHNDLINLFKSR